MTLPEERSLKTSFSRLKILVISKAVFTLTKVLILLIRDKYDSFFGQKKGRIPFGVKVLICDIKTGSAYTE
ncbi:hypothetical protein [uncultured Nostoc sp.]|uniref:hypothetical protein n=1 Tax=uncultured Nostoc sp. TaxID=340711 RepID=UPI0035CC77C8